MSRPRRAVKLLGLRNWRRGIRLLSVVCRVPCRGRFKVVRLFSAFFSRKRSDQDVEVAVSEHFRGRIRMTVCSDGHDKTIDNLESEFFMRFLAAFKTKLQAHFGVIAKELDCMVHLGLEIVRV